MLCAFNIVPETIRAVNHCCDSVILKPMNSKITVLIDIDNTIAQTQHAYIRYANAFSDKPFIFEEITREYADDINDPFEALVRGFITSKDYKNTVEAIAPYPGIREAFELLHSAGFRLCVASSRIEDWHKATAQWLDTHGLLPYVDDLYLRTQDINSSDFKQAVAACCGARYGFDDSASTGKLLDMMDTFYLIDQPWNRNISLPSYMLRVRSFKEGVLHLLSTVH